MSHHEHSAAPSAQPSITADSIRTRVAEQAFGRPLVTNALRGHVAEAIVAAALEPEWRWCAADYASWDFDRVDGQSKSRLPFAFKLHLMELFL